MPLSNFGRRVAMALVSCVLVAGLTVGAAPNAHADDEQQWGAIRTAPDGRWEMVWGRPNRQQLAYFGLWSRCFDGCKQVLTFTQCAALATNNFAFSPAESDSRVEAQSEAIFNLPGSFVIASQCNDGSMGSVGSDYRRGD
jgi:hypothetical protein